MSRGHLIGFVLSFVMVSHGSNALAHDLWLIPPAKAEPGQTVTIRAVQGTKFDKGDRAPNASGFVRAALFLNGESESKLQHAGSEGSASHLTFSPNQTGIAIVAVETTPKKLTLDAEAFNSYLVSDGLPHIYLLRAKENSLDKAGVERYSKSPKALVRIGNGKGGDPTRAVGLPLEIVPLQDPFARTVGETLRVKVLFRGKPLTHANLGWDHPGEGELPMGSVRSDEKGEALIPLAKAGLITIRLTHMTRPKMVEYEWESFWTTLTFLLPEKGK